MRLSTVALLMLVALGAVSCSENKAPKQQSPSLAAAPGADAGAKPAGVQRAAPIPKGSQWTILCREISGPGHIERARQFKEALMKTPGMRDWHLLHKENQSQIYYGYYKSYTDARAQADHQKVDSMTDAQGRRPFRIAVLVPLDAADVGPPEWNLVNAKGYWSLQIGAYKNSPERKQYAVDAVRAARQQGVEAYYYHGENMSVVCVGSWPREAVSVADSNVRAGDGGELKLVLPPLPPDVLQAPEIRQQDGKRLHVEAGRNEVVDKSLKEMMDRYPSNAINGATMIVRRTDPRTGQVREVADASFPVRIPREAPSLLDVGGVPMPPPEGAFNDAITPRTTNGGGATGQRAIGS